MHAALSCESKCIGKAYGVLAKRRAKIKSEAIPEGETTEFVIVGYLPATEAVGISEDIRLNNF